MTLLLPLVVATAIDGGAALEHARRLAALGPHPWGTTLDKVAAEYVASQFREVGLEEVRLEPFESHGLFGHNVLGVLRAPNPQMIVVGAHHDTVPDSPGAYDDSGGVGVVIEAARALARDGGRPLTIVFASWDAEEAFSQRPTTTAGSRAFIKMLGADASQVVAAIAVEMCGWSGGRPCLHPIAYADPRRPGRTVIAPAWLVETTLSGARSAGSALCVGDPWFSWVYQPAVRVFRTRLSGDDLSFVQNGLPAVFVSDSSLSAFYPWYHQPGDTADKLDAAALERMGAAVLGAVDAVGRAPRGAATEDSWFAVGGRVVGPRAVYGLGVLMLVPGLLIASRNGSVALGTRALYSLLVGVLLWRHPLPAAWVFALPSVVPLIRRRLWTSLAALLPLAALIALGAAAWRRGVVNGLWTAPWELALAGLALVLVWFLPRRTRRRR